MPSKDKREDREMGCAAQTTRCADPRGGAMQVDQGRFQVEEKGVKKMDKEQAERGWERLPGVAGAGRERKKGFRKEGRAKSAGRGWEDTL